MSFKLTDEQLMIQSMVREFSRKVVAETAAERDKTKEFPAKNLKQMAELGLMGMMVPFDYEGLGFRHGGLCPGPFRNSLLLRLDGGGDVGAQFHCL
jgi:alkylation response protein AidB-like acyl-CoA dehydrogenase